MLIKYCRVLHTVDSQSYIVHSSDTGTVLCLAASDIVHVSYCMRMHMQACMCDGLALQHPGFGTL